MILREWKKEDVEKIVQIEEACFPDPWSKEMFFDAFSLPICHGVVAEEEGEVIGYACQTVLFEDAELLNIAVSPQHRKKGVGRAIIEKIEQKATELGAERLLLEVRVGNEAALSLYRSFGFEDLSVRKRYYEDGEDALVMQKII